MIAAGNPNVKGDEGIIRFKELVSEELTKFSSSILLDPEYGLPAAKLRHEDCGLLISYEKNWLRCNRNRPLTRLTSNLVCKTY